MTDWQTILGFAFVVAVLTGRPDWRIPAVWLANFIATMNLAAFPLAVGVADIAAAALLVSCGVRGRVVAALYLAMVPVYFVATAFHWSGSATYAIIDALAFAQLAVVGNVDGGIRYLGRSGYRRLHHWRSDLGRAAMARHLEPHKEEGR